MATKRGRPQPRQKLDRDLMELLLFGAGRARRFTQDSPVLPDVWLEYAKGPGNGASRRASRTDRQDPFPPVKLLLTPYRELAAGEVRRVVHERLRTERQTRRGVRSATTRSPCPASSTISPPSPPRCTSRT